MIKACQKKILYLEGMENSIFESAYFLLKEDPDALSIGGDDILKEADRIIRERLPESKKKKRRLEKIKKTILITVSAAAGALAGGCIVSCFSLIL